MKVFITGLVMGLLTLFPVAQASAASANSQKDLQQAQSIVQGCVAHGNFLTHGGREGIINCIAPKGHKQAFMNCAQGQLAHANLLTKHGRSNYEQALAVCVEKNR